jgi:hypothetical protein
MQFKKVRVITGPENNYCCFSSEEEEFVQRVV